MGSCKFCGDAAGFLRKSHKACKQKNIEGKERIESLVASVGSVGGDLKTLDSSIQQVASTSYIDRDLVKALVASGWAKAVEIAFEDGVLSEEEEAALSDVKAHFSLSQQELDKNGAFTKIIKGAILRDVLNGVLPQRIELQGNLPFNLQKAEQVVWLFHDVDYYEEKTRTRYEGGSQGVSIRVAKGLYYRAGAFKGERVQSTETIHADTGLLGVTNKHIYFKGSSKNFRINYNKIVSFEMFSDGIGVQRDAQTAKPQSFTTDDGWFTYNLITNLAQI